MDLQPQKLSFSEFEIASIQHVAQNKPQKIESSSSIDEMEIVERPRGREIFYDN